MNIDLNKLSHLANMPISDPQNIFNDLSDITTHFKILDNVDIDGVTPTLQVTGLKNIFRDDKIETTPPIHDSYFTTNSVINKDGQ